MPLRPLLSDLRAITIIHLLTNREWGEGVPKMKFLSCRQSIPARQRTQAVGNKDIIDMILDGCSCSREALNSSFSAMQRLRQIKHSLVLEKKVADVRFLEDSVALVVQLIPSVNSSSQGVTGTVRLVGSEPQLSLPPRLSKLTNHKYRIQIVMNGDMNNCDRKIEPCASIMEEIENAQLSAIDFSIVDILQNENLQLSNWNRVSVSKFEDIFSVSYALIQPPFTEVTITLRPNARESETAVKLREAFLGMCASRTTNVSLSQIALSDIESRIN